MTAVLDHDVVAVADVCRQILLLLRGRQIILPAGDDQRGAEDPIELVAHIVVGRAVGQADHGFDEFPIAEHRPQQSAPPLHPVVVLRIEARRVDDGDRRVIVLHGVARGEVPSLADIVEPRSGCRRRIKEQQALHLLRVLDGIFQTDFAAVGNTGNAEFFDLKMLQQRVHQPDLHRVVVGLAQLVRLSLIHHIHEDQPVHGTQRFDEFLPTRA